MTKPRGMDSNDGVTFVELQNNFVGLCTWGLKLQMKFNKVNTD